MAPSLSRSSLDTVADLKVSIRSNDLSSRILFWAQRTALGTIGHNWAQRTLSELCAQQIGVHFCAQSMFRMFFGGCSPHHPTEHYALSDLCKYKIDLMISFREIWFWAHWALLGTFSSENGDCAQRAKCAQSDGRRRPFNRGVPGSHATQHLVSYPRLCIIV